MPKNVFSRRDMYFDSEACMQNYIEYTIVSLAIRYDKNVVTKVEQSDSLVMCYLCYIQVDSKEKAKVH
jgi:hypothetical protein